MGYSPQGSGDPNTSSILTISQRSRADLIFRSTALAIISITDVAANIVFPSIVVSGLPSGLTIAYADVSLIFRELLETGNAGENQIDIATGKLHMKAAAAAWSAATACLVFPQNSLEVAQDSRGSGGVIPGAIDIKAVLAAGDGTYNFQSDEDDQGEGVTATDGNIEIHDGWLSLAVWYN
jgi:hypothetical protein